MSPVCPSRQQYHSYYAHRHLLVLQLSASTLYILILACYIYILYHMPVSSCGTALVMPILLYCKLQSYLTVLNSTDQVAAPKSPVWLAIACHATPHAT